jgi:hypothetical protein
VGSAIGFDVEYEMQNKVTAFEVDVRFGKKT